MLVRKFHQTIKENNLLPVPLVIVNRPGAGGSDGSRHVKDLEPDGYSLLNLHDAMMISKVLREGVDYGAEEFECVAGTVRSGLVVAVSKDSPYNNLTELMDDVVKRPEDVIFGCAFGTPTEVTGRLIQNAVPNAKFNMINAGGGKLRFEQLLGNHIHVSVFSAGEYVKYKTLGIRAIAYMGEERHEKLPDLPTAKEQGVDVVNDVVQYWWFPKGTDPEIVAYMSDVLKKALEDEKLKKFVEDNMMTPEFFSRELLQGRITQVENKLEGMTSGVSYKLPPFEKWVMALIGLLIVYIAVSGFFKLRQVDEDEEKPDNTHVKSAVVAMAMTLGYIVILDFEWLDFRILTFIFMMSVGLLLIDWTRRNSINLLECALLVSLGTHYIFTQIVNVDLP